MNAVFTPLIRQAEAFQHIVSKLIEIPLNPLMLSALRKPLPLECVPALPPVTLIRICGKIPFPVVK
jgi:hypothetical protein